MSIANLRKALTLISLLLAGAGVTIWFHLPSAALAGSLLVVGLLNLRWPSGPLSHLMLIISTAMSALFLLRGIPAWLSVGLVAFILGAWDLQRFESFTNHMHDIAQRQWIERIHLKRLAAALAGGFALAFVSQLMQFQFSFIVMVILGMALILAFTALSRYLLRERP